MCVMKNVDFVAEEKTTRPTACEAQEILILKKKLILVDLS